MKRNMFGDPRPTGHAEIEEAMEELGIDADSCTAKAQIEGEDDGFGNTGWTADISGVDDEDEIIEIATLAYPEKDTLIADLKAAGIKTIEVEQ